MRRDFVIIGISPWDFKIGSNCKNIALELSKRNRVLFVNSPLNRYSKIFNKGTEEIKKRITIIDGQEEGLEQIDENLWTLYPSKLIESINKIPQSFLYRYLNKRNNRIFCREILKAVDQLGLKDIILFNDSEIFLGYFAVKLLQPTVSIYYIRDYLIMQPYFSRHGADMEPQLAAKYDVVVANSEFLVNYLKAYNKHTYMVGQGCDLKNFDYSMTYIPEELERIRNPIIGYVGFLTSLRLDIELISNIARNRPDYSIVLVGPEDEDFMQSKLHQIENVYFLGSKNEVELSSYINGFDVAINPQLVNMMTIGNYPRKIDEYLAMGKPIVATATIAMAYFKQNVYLSKNEDEFLTNIDLAIKENNDELIKQRVDRAMSHSWENNVEQIYNVINKL